MREALSIGFWVFAIPSLLIVSVLFGIRACNTSDLPHHYVIEIANEKTHVLCRFCSMEKCGIMLSKCSDGAEYGCLTNVVDRGPVTP